MSNNDEKMNILIRELLPIVVTLEESIVDYQKN
jgi:hypothetical protein